MAPKIEFNRLFRPHFQANRLANLTLLRSDPGLLYPASTEAEAEIAQAQSSRDQSMVSMYLWAKERAKTARTNAFIYLWDHALPGPDAERFGAFHTGEVPYVMNTLYMSDRSKRLENFPLFAGSREGNLTDHVHGAD